MKMFVLSMAVSISACASNSGVLDVSVPLPVIDLSERGPVQQYLPVGSYSVRIDELSGNTINLGLRSAPISAIEIRLNDTATPFPIEGGDFAYDSSEHHQAFAVEGDYFFTTRFIDGSEDPMDCPAGSRLRRVEGPAMVESSRRLQMQFIDPESDVSLAQMHWADLDRYSTKGTMGEVLASRSICAPTEPINSPVRQSEIQTGQGQ